MDMSTLKAMALQLVQSLFACDAAPVDYSMANFHVVGNRMFALDLETYGNADPAGGDELVARIARDMLCEMRRLNRDPRDPPPTPSPPRERSPPRWVEKELSWDDFL